MVAGVMIPHLPHGVVVAVVVVASMVPLGALTSVGLGGRAAGVKGWARLGLLTMLGFLAWGGFVVGLALLHAGWGRPYRWTAVLEVVAFAVPPIIGFTALRRAPRLRQALAHRSGLWRLASIQIARNLGLVFLVLHAERKLPGLFAYPAGWGDIAVGVTAPIAMWAVWFREDEIRRRGSPWQRAFIGWNIVGLADHIVAVTLGTLYYPGVTGVFGGPPDTAMFAELPMLLFPMFMVPFADTLHLIMIDVVRRPVGEALVSRAGAGRRRRDAVVVGGEA
jgi:hypothetical protein